MITEDERIRRMRMSFAESLNLKKIKAICQKHGWCEMSDKDLEAMLKECRNKTVVSLPITDKVARMAWANTKESTTANIYTVAAEIFRDGVDREVFEPAVPVYHRFDRAD